MTDETFPSLPIEAASYLELPDEREGGISYAEGYERKDNWCRATGAASAMRDYAVQTYGLAEEFCTVLSDLLSDLMHLVDALQESEPELDFQACLQVARRTYDAELRGVL